MSNGLDLDNIIKDAISKFYKENEKHLFKDIDVDSILSNVTKIAQENEKPIIINIYLPK